MNNFEFWRQISGLLFVVKNKQQITREIWHQNSKLFMAQIPLSRKLENPIFRFCNWRGYFCWSHWCRNRGNLEMGRWRTFHLHKLGRKRTEWIWKRKLLGDQLLPRVERYSLRWTRCKIFHLRITHQWVKARNTMYLEVAPILNPLNKFVSSCML